MANLNVVVVDGNTVNVEVVPTPRQTITIDKGVAGVGIESVAFVEISGDYFIEITYTNGTTELVPFPDVLVGVTSFNTRVGAVTLTNTDVTGALGYTPPTPTGTGASGTWAISVSGNAANVTGVVAIANGGTNATTASAARTNLGLGTSAVLNVGVPSGVASLDSGGKVPVSELPAAVLGALSYQGTWNASTNTPTLASGVGTKGYYYVVSVAGSTNLDGVTDWLVGDWAVYNGTAWQQIDNTDTVESVNGQTGVVVLDAADVGAVGTITSSDGSINVVTTGSTVDIAVSEASPASTLLGSVRNQTGATLTKGTVVYISGATGNKALVSKAIATSDATSAQTYGVITTDLANNANGYVTIIGALTNLNTSAFTEGVQLYLSSTTAGAYTATKQYAPNHLVYVGVVTRSHPTQGSIEVKIQNGYEMDELHNVSAQTPSNGNVLIWNNSTQLWESAGISAGTGISVTNGAGSITVSNTGVTSVGGTGTVNGLTLTGTVTNTGNLTLGGSLSGVDLTTQVTGTLPVANGGTGATTLTGYVKGSGTSALTASSTIPNTDISGLGTMSTQNATTVAITGGSVNGTSVGATTAAAGSFTDFAASGSASFTSTGAVKLPVGTAAQRPTPAAGMLRFNDDTDEFEGYNGAAWSSVGGSAITNDTTTSTNVYPLFANATSGTASSVFTSNAKLLYKPSTGELQSTVLNASNGIVVNSATVNTSYTIPSGSNAMSAGAIAISSGITVTVPSGARWVIL